MTDSASRSRLTGRPAEEDTPHPADARVASNRRAHIRRAVQEGLFQWPGLVGTKGPASNRYRPAHWPPATPDGDNLDDLDPAETAIPVDPTQPGVLKPLYRRRFLRASMGTTSPPKMRFLVFRPHLIQVISRLFLWLWLFLRFTLGTLGDKLSRRDTPQRRATRLRRTFEKVGGTFVKIGLHMAVRLDFLPWAYSIALSQMVDRVPPMPIQQALEIIERDTGIPAHRSFARFDPEPIISTTVACIYQAIAHNGQKMVVKVRRPGIGERFMAHMQALDWLLATLEWLTILRPGATYDVRREMRQTLLEELNFVQEARYQDLFQRAARKSGKTFFTAPRIHFDLSGEEVVVEEFVSGLWLWELLAAVENKDVEALAEAQKMDIDPGVVARRLAWVSFWGWDESLFFYANPRPENIIIGHGSQLIFTDFSTVGAIDRSKRRALQRNMDSIWKQDALGMARASLTLLEPLPPIDLIEFTKELEGHNWQMLYALENKNPFAHWTEQTTAIQWIGLINVASKYGVVIDLHILHLLRAMMMYEALSARLDNQIDIIKEYREFNAFRADQAYLRVNKNLRQQLRRGGDDKIYLRLERMTKVGEGLYYRVRQLAAQPAVSFHTLLGKWSFAFIILFRFLYQALLVTGMALTLAILPVLLTGTTAINWPGIWAQTITNRVYQFVIILLVFVNGRNVLFRMDDKDV
ncbi:MAG: AarF/ABC1/UbiB kinase family protein [Chloroflexi bacterium]|nr:AarF/ABC1/UbiB kinase family protein [Chloroflexota bacterium]MCI0581200.1 AarF/ABC1/UbiB kinase family protein [Chloroflexota bacterium]MCI0644124.1 AarF/ABC1/UbiB kinase family protein [Chloroflexota bacterium]MCI0731745.1 AarF/ABC1/UbiB kinase family protein [Chloroflexota bacterium]